MSKMDNLRAMREARFERATARAQGVAATRPTPLRVAPTAPTTEFVAEPFSGEELCGHRNMSGRTCTRERGHEAKSHRYS